MYLTLLFSLKWRRTLFLRLWYIVRKPSVLFCSVSLYRPSLLSVCLQGEFPLGAVVPVPEPPAAHPAAAAPPSSPTAPVRPARPGGAGQAALLLGLRGPQRLVPQSLQVRLRAVLLTARCVSALTRARGLVCSVYVYICTDTHKNLCQVPRA